MKKKAFKLITCILVILFSGSSISNANNLFGSKSVEYRFTENIGQLVDFDGQIRNEFLFYSNSNNLDIYFRKNGITYIFKNGEDIPKTIGLSKEDEVKIIKAFLNQKTLYYRLDIDFAGSVNENIIIKGESKSEYSLNYYYPHCPNGIHNVKSFQKIVYANVYEGIDFEFYFLDDQFKYDVILNENADINNVKINFNGAKDLSLINNEINIQSPVGRIIETLPKSYYLDQDGVESKTDIKYQLDGDIINFISSEKINSKLVIDPQISWTTYYDDCFWNGSGSSIDVKGNQFVITTYGFSSAFPTLDPGGSAYYQNSVAGSGDYRILKFDTDGVRIWATYYGGTGYDHSPHVKIDYAGNIFVAGHTESSDIPVQNAGGYYDGTYTAGTYSGGTCILKFNSNGVRQWGTHYDYVHYPMLEVDHNNNLYVLGRSEYDNPPVLALAGAYNQATVSPDASSGKSMDIFIVKFNSSTARTWATNLGSTCDEFLQDVHIGSDNYINIVGYGDNYYGTGIITYNPGGGAHYDNTLGIGTGGSSTDRDDALIYRFNTSGAMVWGTAFSGTLAENMQQGRITTDNSNNIYIYGETRSTDLPCTNPGGGAYYDNVFNASGSGFNPFIARFNSGGVLNWCTYFGTYGLGYGMNFSHYIGINNDNNLILVATEGGGVGGTFPLVPRTGDYNATLAVYMGVYIAEFASDLSVAWSTYYAGTTDRNTLGDCALSSNSCGYELYMTTNWEKWNGAAIDPPWVQPIPTAFQNTTFNSSGLITRLSVIPSTAPSSITASPATFCSGGSTDLTVNGGSLGSGADWYWYEGGCGSGSSIGTGTTINVSPSTTTTYYVRAEGDCNTTTCASITVTVGTNSIAPTSASASPSTLCSGGSTTLSVSGGSLGTNAIWEWYSGSCGGTFVGSGSSISVSPSSTTTYYVLADGDCNTTSCVSVTVTVGTSSTDPISATTTNTTICEGSTTDLTVNGGSLGTNATWEWYSGSCGGTPVGSGNIITVTPSSATTYYVMAEGDCNNTACVNISINVSIMPNAGLNGSISICEGEPSFDLDTLLGGNPDIGGAWTNSIGTIVSNTFDPFTMTSDIFSYTVSGTSPCPDSIATVSVTVNPLPNVAFVGLDTAYCQGSSTVDLTGNQAPNGIFSGIGITDNGNGTASFNPSSLGIQTVTYSSTDGNGCTASIDQTVNVTAGLELDTAIVTDVSCNGTNGSISVLISGGSGIYTYLWSNDSTTATISGLSAASYDLTVTDANGCDLITLLIVQNNGGGLTTTMSNVVDVDCNGNNNGAATVSAGAGSYTYLWSNSDTTSTISNLSGGTYYVTVSDLFGCQGIDTVFIDEPSILTYSDLITDVSCNGGSDGIIDLNTSGGTPNYSYTWLPSGYIVSGDTYSGLPPNTYAVTITDANGCYITIPKLDVGEPELINISFAGNMPSCYGYSDGVCYVSATGGSSPYSYVWSEGTTGSTITNISVGVYYVTLTDANSCIVIDTLSLPTLAQILYTEIVTDASCNGNNDGEIHLDVYNGNGPFTFEWNTVPAQTDSVAIGLIAGIYEVTITDKDGCEIVKEFEVIDGNESCLVIPTVFTPNNDGKNDFWEIEGIHLFPEALIEVYNRWGDIIFESNGYNEPWDGTFNGKELPISSYVYIINLNNESEPIQGIVTIKK